MLAIDQQKLMKAQSLNCEHEIDLPGKSLACITLANEPDCAGPAGFEIAFALRQRGQKQVDVARHLGVSVATLNNVLHGRASSYPVAAGIAGILETTVDSLWPGRYVFKPRKRVRERVSAEQRAIDG